MGGGPIKYPPTLNKMKFIDCITLLESCCLACGPNYKFEYYPGFTSIWPPRHHVSSNDGKLVIRFCCNHESWAIDQIDKHNEESKSHRG